MVITRAMTLDEDSAAAILPEGETRLHAGETYFLFKRLKPGIIFTAIAGANKGELGTLPLEEIRNEFARFRRPITWLIDSEQSPYMVSSVFESWTGWLLNNRHIFSSIQIFTAEKAMNMSLSIAKHLTGASRLIITHGERNSFEKAVAKACDGNQNLMPSEELLESWKTVSPVTIEKQFLKDGAVKLSNDKCSFTFKRIDTNIIFSSIEGIYDGSLGDGPIDYMCSELDLCTKPLTWFIDVKSKSISVQHPETWSYWIANNQKNINKVLLLTTSNTMRLLIEILNEKLNVRKRVQISKSREEFEASIKAKVPDFLTYSPP
jgi:hypothetical protein